MSLRWPQVGHYSCTSSKMNLRILYLLARCRTPLVPVSQEHYVGNTGLIYTCLQSSNRTLLEFAPSSYGGFIVYLNERFDDNEVLDAHANLLAARCYLSAGNIARGPQLKLYLVVDNVFYPYTNTNPSCSLSGSMGRSANTQARPTSFHVVTGKPQSMCTNM